MPDPVRISATENVAYDGSFKPSFFNAEAFCGLGVSADDLVENAEWFSSGEAYRKWLDIARAEVQDSESDHIYTLKVCEAGARYGDRCNITLRIPEEWPPHSLMELFLKGSGLFPEDKVNSVKTFKDQLDMLKTMEGWHDVHVTGAVNEAFATRVSNALELIYFGVDVKKVQNSQLMQFVML